MPWVEPTPLKGRFASLEPLAPEHLDGLVDAVKDGELSKLFRRMAEAKSTLVQELSNEVKPTTSKARTKRATHPSEWVANVNATYTTLRGGLKVMRADQVTQIEQTEADLLGRIQRIRHDRDHSYVVRVLAMQYEA